jgi:hypothetical protein
MKMTGKRPKGRTRTWWLDQVKTDMEIRVWTGGGGGGGAEEMQEWTERDSCIHHCKSLNMLLET